MTPMGLLLCDDEPAFIDPLAQRLASRGYQMDAVNVMCGLTPDPFLDMVPYLKPVSEFKTSFRSRWHRKAYPVE
jgi:hypothetical protein